MRGKLHTLFTISGVLLLSASLMSCSSPGNQPISEPHSSPPTLTSPGSTIIDPQPIDALSPPSELPTSSPSESPLAPIEQPTESGSSQQPDVEATTSTVAPDPSIKPVPPKDTKKPVASSTSSFRKDSPSLHGLTLGISEQAAMSKLGEPTEIYSLPGDTNAVEIWQYSGYSIGLSAQDKVVYIEVTSPEIATGIKGLTIGTQGTTAAQILGIDSDNSTQVLTLEVTAGWFKLDLDPDSQSVISLKLISNNL